MNLSKSNSSTISAVGSNAMKDRGFTHIEGPKEETVRILYKPLPANATRLLHVSRQGPEQLLELQLVGLLIDDQNSSLQIPYTALSYTWSDASNPATIHINDYKGVKHPVSVTRNLYSFLETIGEGAYFYWIDQICINQASIVEKTQQVNLMRSIYEHATSVFIWLGPSDIHSKVAMLKIIECRNSIHARLDAGHQNGLDSRQLARLIKPDLLGPLTEEGLEQWKAVKHFLEREWFRRTWIWQEATALPFNREADLVTIGCDQEQMDFRDLCDFASFFSMLSSGFSSLSKEFEVLKEVPSQFVGRIDNFATRRRSRKGPALLLMNLLEEVRVCEATDPRDKVFAMLSFAADDTVVAEPGDAENDSPGHTGGSKLSVDYGLTTKQVYTNVVKWYVSTYRDLDFLGYCSIDNKLQLPSWVPDWSTNKLSLPFRKRAQRSVPTSQRLYSAAGIYGDSILIREPLPSNPEILAVSGSYVTTIARVSNPGKDYGTAEEQEWFQIIGSSQEICPVNQMPLSEVLAKTVVADQGIENIYSEGGQSRGGSLDLHTFTSNPSDLPLAQIQKMKTITQHRSLFISTTEDPNTPGLIGIGPEEARPGDEIWMFQGGSMLYILRPFRCGEGGSAKVLDLTGGSHESFEFKVGDRLPGLIGECFIHGLMDGQLVSMMEQHESRNMEIPSPLRGMGREFGKIYLA